MTLARTHAHYDSIRLLEAQAAFREAQARQQQATEDAVEIRKEAVRLATAYRATARHLRMEGVE